MVRREAHVAVAQRGIALVAIGTASWLFTLGLRAQAPVPSVKLDVVAARGLQVSPVYEGWYQIGAARYALFGYFNRNLEEIVNVPVGPDNAVTPGPMDQGQPTRFFPGQHFGVFAVAVPGEKTEVTWTLAANGYKFSIPAFLDPLYLVQPQRDEAGTYPGNTPPTVKFDPAGQSAQGPFGVATSRAAVVSQPLVLDVWVTDDGLPPPPGVKGAAPALRGTPGGRGRRQGLMVSWIVHRGPGAVTFSNPTPPVEGGKAVTTATFSTAGEYMLRVLAEDSRTGNKCCWTNGYVKVAVRDAGPPR
jgi:hypothetical protein